MMALEEIEKRLRVVEDIEEIKQLQIRYVNCLTFADWGSIMDVFAQDAVLDVFMGGTPITDRAEIEKTFREKVSKMHVGKEGNFLVHPLVSVDGDKAKGTWLIYFMHSETIQMKDTSWAQGIYDTEYVRENGKWKISRLKWTARLFTGEGGPLPE